MSKDSHHTSPTESDRVTVFEVGPRDGLQNEKQAISLDAKIELVNALTDAGFLKIETGSFVSPKWVPQMASSAKVFEKIQRRPGVQYSALTPNMQGFEAAMQADVDEVAVFAAASEGFSQANINCSITESFERFAPLLDAAKANSIPVRAYVSCVIACPYDGVTPAQAVADVAQRLFNQGCYEISLGDTIGVGTPKQIKNLLGAVSDVVPMERLAIHCHDTYGQAIANITAALEMGVRTVDSAIAGLGGCPYAKIGANSKAASGNVATEDVLYLLDGLGMHTGIDLQKAAQAGQRISAVLGRESQSKTARALY